ncbi:MAG TPA: RNA polymerase sigma factor [Rhizomicrobium sp.]|jgi:RNA polymerase sigma factor (sigma-70 family)|nr:RNA polymerase sigma factor [Rhizomicrobium sp.]
MAKGPDLNREGEPQGAREADTSKVDDWFTGEVLPLEVLLMQFLQHNWRDKNEIADLRQEVYVRVYEAATQRVPEKPKQFLFATARNLLIDRVRKAQIVPIAAATDLETLEIAGEEPGPDRVLVARDELRRMRDALDRLQPRWREAIILGRIEGLSRREIAQRMGVTELTAAQYLSLGISALIEILDDEHHGRKP